MMWYGPNNHFKVIDVRIKGGSSQGYANAMKAHGTSIKHALLNANGNTTSTVDVLHMTTINNQLIEAFQSKEPAKQILPSGTGATPFSNYSALVREINRNTLCCRESNKQWR